MHIFAVHVALICGLSKLPVLVPSSSMYCIAHISLYKGLFCGVIPYQQLPLQ